MDRVRRAAGLVLLFAFLAGLRHRLRLGFESQPGQPYSGWLRKFTIAQQIGPKPEFFARPLLRLFVTYGNWSDALIGRVGGGPYATKTMGLTAGVQAETWW